jgi:hypothetical protein
MDSRVALLTLSFNVEIKSAGRMIYSTCCRISVKFWILNFWRNSIVISRSFCLVINIRDRACFRRLLLRLFSIIDFLRFFRIRLIEGWRRFGILKKITNVLNKILESFKEEMRI